MKVIGYAPRLPFPFVPRFILTPGGLFDRDNHPADGEAVTTHEFSIEDSEWVGVNVDGQVETFRRSNEKEWRSRQSQLAVANVDPKATPEQTLRRLRAAADIVGFDLPALLAKLEQDRNPGESYADTWKRKNQSST